MKQSSNYTSNVRLTLASYVPTALSTLAVTFSARRGHKLVWQGTFSSTLSGPRVYVLVRTGPKESTCKVKLGLTSGLTFFWYLNITQHMERKIQRKFRLHATQDSVRYTVVHSNTSSLRRYRLYPAIDETSVQS